MGQLEKYGLYVLCLVIFLILGVALWGDPAAAADRPSSASQQARTNASASDAEAVDFYNLVQQSGGQVPAGPSVEPKPLAGGRGSDAGGSGGESNRQPEAQKRDEPKPPVTPVKTEPTVEAARETYTVAEGDTLSSIASKKAGSVRFVPLLQTINPGLVPEKLKVGQKILLPTASELATSGGTTAKKADAPSGSGNLRTHVVEAGDTFEGIAERVLGDKKRVGEIKKLNATLDPTKLRVGQKILLPAK